MDPVYTTTSHIIAVKHNNDRESDLVVLASLMAILALIVVGFFVIKTSFASLKEQTSPTVNTTEVEERLDLYV